MTFHSILFDTDEGGTTPETLEPPVFFVDLNLDQIIDAVTAGRQEYNLRPFFYTPLKRLDAVEYRHEVMQDLEDPILFEHVQFFAERMRAMREHLAQADKSYYKHQKERWFLDAVELYCTTVTSLLHDLSLVELRSRGLRALRDYLSTYVASDEFRSLLADTRALEADLSDVSYCVLIEGDGFKVRKYEFEADYSTEVEGTFERFEQGAVTDYRVKFPTRPEMNHVEAKVLEFVALLYPELFSSLDRYCDERAAYLDETIAVFDREVQFYLAYLEYAARFEHAGLRVCYPRLSDESKDVYDHEGFDLALASRLIREGAPVVCNDFYLKGNERILVVSGPNQGGKTTFARTFGQLHYLASLGCPVPGREARLFLFDRLFTHFEREEEIQNLRGKLQDDLIRIHDILGEATSNSIIIMNEICTSTTLHDALFLSKTIMERIMALDVLCVWVTFIDELASLGEQTVSMVSTVVPENPALRTYKILRRRADGLSYAMSIAEKYRLTYDCVRERVRS